MELDADGTDAGPTGGEVAKFFAVLDEVEQITCHGDTVEESNGREQMEGNGGDILGQVNELVVA